MRPEDLPSAQAVTNAAFLDFFEQMTGVRPEPLFGRHFPSRFTREPEGCFVAEAEGIVGVILSVTWGSLGWFGPVAVAPSAQGQKIARRLLDAVFERWGAMGLAVEGLETFPQSPLHLSLYERYGFRPRFLTPHLVKGLEEGAVPSVGVDRFSSFDGNAQAFALKACRDLGEVFFPDLDFTKEIRLAAALHLGETFLLEGGRRGFAVCHTRPGAEGAPGRFGFVHLMAVRPGTDAEAGFLHLLRACEAFAVSEALSELRLAVNTAYVRAYDCLRGRGYRIALPLVRMTRGRPWDSDPGHFLLDNWR